MCTTGGAARTVSLVSRIVCGREQKSLMGTKLLQLVAQKFSAIPRIEIVLLLYVGGAGFGLEIPCTVWSKVASYPGRAGGFLPHGGTMLG